MKNWSRSWSAALAASFALTPLAVQAQQATTETRTIVVQSGAGQTQQIQVQVPQTVPGVPGQPLILTQPVPGVGGTGPGYAYPHQPAETVDLGRYMIGLSCESANDTLRRHLKLEPGTGLVVKGASTDSPAAKAGLKEHDVLTKADGKPMRSLKDLVDAVQAAETKEMKLDLIRDGQPITATVTPLERPEGQRNVRVAVTTGYPGFWNSIGSGVVMNQPHAMPSMMALRHPGPVVLPPNVSVSISRTGSDPAKIQVSRGDEKWDITEKELDKLPSDLREPVEKMLGQHYHILRWPANVLHPQPTILNAPHMPGIGPAPSIAPQVVAPTPQPSEFEALKNELKKLSEQVQKLEKSLAKPETDAK